MLRCLVASVVVPAVPLRGGFALALATERLSPEHCRLQIKTAFLEAEAGTLSGGNQQKVALARSLATRSGMELHLLFRDVTADP